MSFIPLWINPLTDLSNILTPKLFLTSKKNLCAELFLKYIDCIEAYGATKGSRECAAILFDSMECTHHTFQLKRRDAIYKERMKQYREGKIDKPFEENPPLDEIQMQMLN
ncbi:NADH-Ubiquinone oxidoreductase 15KDa subunit [Pediculus humanus corporis]|uniref:NADH-Ubiquinone oxidoreductase 15kDa subunit n=1 Tax=Pediculus humanus subsp. corporis TaxID=121224 RepID=E0VQI2_PEDHC|nr:NADH-Ubiquinone oxidoreductase 15KDa subunit [Pediculus humanus corporis]EEB15638.1 NADH-Ubiquinone oxidoreductase 15KDa subunit [Pediculus humanus corporis]